MNFYGHPDAVKVTFTFGNGASGQINVTVDGGAPVNVQAPTGVGVFTSAALAKRVTAYPFAYIITPLAEAGATADVSVEVAHDTDGSHLVPSPTNVPPGNPYLLAGLTMNVGSVGSFDAVIG